MFFIYIISLLFVSCSTHTVFHRYEKWYHPETKQIVHLLGDSHVDQHDCATTFKQAYDLGEYIGTFGQNCLVIAEDMPSLAQDRGYASIAEFFPTYIPGQDPYGWAAPMGGLVARCQNDGIPVINAECRLPDNPSLHPEVTVDNSLLIKNRIAKIQQYKNRESNPVLKQYYNDIINGAHGLQGSNLLDAYVLNKIHINHAVSHIVVPMGSYHTDNIGRFLSKIGCQPSSHYGSTNKEYVDSVNNILKRFDHLSETHPFEYEKIALRLQLMRSIKDALNIKTVLSDSTKETN